MSPWLVCGITWLIAAPSWNSSFCAVDDARRCDDDRLRWHIARIDRRARRSGFAPALGRFRDLVDDVHSGGDLAEHRIADAARIRATEIEPRIVVDVDEELIGRGVRIGRARHRNRSGRILETGLAADLGLVDDRRPSRFWREIAWEATALNR